MFLFFVGWILNLGNRLNVVERLYAGQPPYFTGFRPWSSSFCRGCVSFAAIATYLSPSMIFGATAVYLKLHGNDAVHYAFAVLSVIFFALGVFTLPGCMTVYAAENDKHVLLHPLAAFRRSWQQRKHYLLAWRIAICSILLSLGGLLFLGVGFFFTSVWAWEVVGYAFTVAMYMPLPEHNQGS